MALLQKLKSLLGLDSDSESGERRDVGVTVERDTASTETESAVKGVDTAGGGEGTVDDAVATDTDAAASTGSMVEEPDRPDEAAEPAEAVSTTGGEADLEPEPSSDETDEDGATTADEGDETATADEAVSDEDAEDVDVIKGIGPSYADRLADAGVHDVADLAAADSDDLADETGLSPKRVSRWVERAKHRVS